MAARRNTPCPALSQVLSSIRRKEKPVRLRADGFVKVIPLRTEKVRPPDVLIDKNCVIGVEPGPLNAAMITRLMPAAVRLCSIAVAADFTGPKLAKKMLFTYLLADAARSFGFRTPNCGDKEITWSTLV
jgi:hypothetical protein